MQTSAENCVPTTLLIQYVMATFSIRSMACTTLQKRRQRSVIAYFCINHSFFFFLSLHLVRILAISKNFPYVWVFFFYSFFVCLFVCCFCGGFLFCCCCCCCCCCWRSSVVQSLFCGIAFLCILVFETFS